MKLQYLGDARDAFKWDLLHWICTTSSFSKLVYVPLLTPYDPKKSNEGRTSHHRFKCEDFIRLFLESLKEEPRCLKRITELGTANRDKQFPIDVVASDREIGSGAERSKYWTDFDVSKFENSVVFFDPDNGYETKTKRGVKWIRHEELRKVFARLPASSVALVYQHRPKLRRWVDVFKDLTESLAYVPSAIAAHEANLSFVGMAGNTTVGQEMARAITEYAQRHPDVEVTPLLPRSQVARITDQKALDFSRQAADLGLQILDRMEAEDAEAGI